MQDTINLLRRQLDSFMSSKNSRSADSTTRMNSSEESLEIIIGRGSEINSCEETSLDENTPSSVGSLNRTFNHEDAKESNSDTISKSQLLVQVGVSRPCLIFSVLHVIGLLASDSEASLLACRLLR